MIFSTGYDPRLALWSYAFGSDYCNSMSSVWRLTFCSVAEVLRSSLLRLLAHTQKIQQQNMVYKYDSDTDGTTVLKHIKDKNKNGGINAGGSGANTAAYTFSFWFGPSRGCMGFEETSWWSKSNGHTTTKWIQERAECTVWECDHLMAG